MARFLPVLPLKVALVDKLGAALPTFQTWWQQVVDAIAAQFAVVGTGIVVSDGTGTGFVRSISGGTGITVANGSGIAGNPTVSISNTAVSAGSAGDATHVPVLTVNAQGQLTSLSSVAITFPSAPVTSVFGRTGVVVSATNDYAFSQISGSLAASQTPAFTGDVTKAAGSGVTVLANIPALSGANLTSLNASAISTGSLALARIATIASNTILANISGGAAVPAATTLTTILDTISSTQGAILYRNASAWVALAPGSSGLFLATGGAGANPTWAAAAGSVSSVFGRSGAVVAASGDYAATQLSDYAATTFTPTVTFGGGSTGLAYTSQVGRYTRIGNRVFFNGSIVLSAKGSSTGAMLIGGLPITSNSAAGGYHAVNVQIDVIASSVTSMQCFILNSATTIQIYGQVAGVNTQITQAYFAGAPSIVFSGHYEV